MARMNEVTWMLKWHRLSPVLTNPQGLLVVRPWGLDFRDWRMVLAKSLSWTLAYAFGSQEVDHQEEEAR